MSDDGRRTGDAQAWPEHRREGPSIVIIGAGDLGRRIATALVLADACGEILFCCRSAATIAPAAALLSASGRTTIGMHEIATFSPRGITAMLREAHPDLIVFAASLLSPWLLNGRDDPAANALRHAGFAGRISAQLPLLIDAMEGIHGGAFEGPVVNCAYPDATNMILGSIGMPPTTGIGNVSMIRHCAGAALRTRRHTSADVEPIRVIAHHAQVPAVMAAAPPDDPSLRPAVFLGSEGQRDDLLPYRHAPIEADRTLNDLSAATALQVIRALLSESGSALSVPGPLALPGGYPVMIDRSGITPDLPHGVTIDDARRLNERAARADGIERIEGDGTLVYTEEAARILNDLTPGLGEPLPPRSALQRFTQLRDALAG